MASATNAKLNGNLASIVFWRGTTRKTGYHAGLGTDIWIGRHATIHADYRYTFIGFGHDADTAPAAVPIPGLRWLQDRLGLSHKGSMWTTGVTVYF